MSFHAILSIINRNTKQFQDYKTSPIFQTLAKNKTSHRDYITKFSVPKPTIKNAIGIYASSNTNEITILKISTIKSQSATTFIRFIFFKHKRYEKSQTNLRNAKWSSLIIMTKHKYNHRSKIQRDTNTKIRQDSSRF